jgi:putative membrane protein insertion efficiency factor
VTPHQKNSLHGALLSVLVLPIRLYRWFVSPLFPQACRFEPTCSEYALEAITTHGAVRGLGLAARRLSRCHPIAWLGGSSGFDPVPPRPCAKHTSA